MKILHVVPGLSVFGGGPSESVPMTALAQMRAGAEVGIAAGWTSRESALSEQAARAGVKMYRFRTRIPGFLNRIVFSGEMFRQFESVARDYDVIVTHCNWMFAVWWAAHVARKLGKPYVMMPRGSFAPARLRQSRWKKLLVGWIDRHYARHAAAVWATSESEAEGVRKYVPEARVEVFPIGLEVERFQSCKVSKLQGFRGERTLLFLSRISPIKGLDLLAEAWGRVSGFQGFKVSEVSKSQRWKLVIVGSDDRGYAGEIEKVFAAKCPKGSYEFRGPAYGEEKTGLLASADAFVLPTRNENWGIAVAEAMASGLPVICTKGAPWSCLETERAGWWTDVSAEGLEKALRELLATDDDELHAMGARGRAWVEKNLDWSVIGAQMLRICEELASEKNR